jgi:hypothetical protein
MQCVLSGALFCAAFNGFFKLLSNCFVLFPFFRAAAVGKAFEREGAIWPLVSEVEGDATQVAGTGFAMVGCSSQ